MKSFEEFVKELEGFSIDDNCRWDAMLHGREIGDAYVRLGDYIAGYMNYVAKYQNEE